jgi:hypothetical protein
VRSTKLPSWIERPLGLSPVAVPPHVFALSRGALSYGSFARDRQGVRVRLFRRLALPRDAFQNGPLGGPPRDAAAFRTLVVDFLKALPVNVHEASLVVPDAWLRVTFAESGELPKTAAALDEVLRWKLRRQVPFRIDDLRIGAAEVAPIPGQEEPRRLLIGFAVESLLAQVEDAFAAGGVRLGQISNASLSLLPALQNASAIGFTASVLVEDEGYTLVFARAGEPVLHRYKGLTSGLPEEAQPGFIVRDLRLTRNFLDEHFPGASFRQVFLLAPPDAEPAWVDRLHAGLGQAALPLDGRYLPALRADEPNLPPWWELAPMLGAAAREVA